MAGGGGGGGQCGALYHDALGKGGRVGPYPKMMIPEAEGQGEVPSHDSLGRCPPPPPGQTENMHHIFSIVVHWQHVMHNLINNYVYSSYVLI